MTKKFKDLNQKCHDCKKVLTKGNSKENAIVTPGNRRICDKCYEKRRPS